MKELVRSHLTMLINDIESEIDENENRFVDGKILKIRLKNLLDYLMDVSEENEAKTLISRSEYEHYLELQRMYEEENF